MESLKMTLILRTTKNMMDSLYEKFKAGYKNGYFVKVGEKAHNMFIGKDEEGRFCFEFRGSFTPVKLIGSKPLAVNQYKDKETSYILRFSLEQDELLGCFAAFGEDLISAAQDITDENLIYHILSDRFQAWKKLFKSDRSRLTEPEIMGLIGELLFLKEKAIPKWGESIALDSWMGPEKTHKDFSCDNEWFEIKTINSGKETVHISSIEQLDSDMPGCLYVYSFEKMSPSYDGLIINKLIRNILDSLETHQKDIFLNKLVYLGFDFSPEYDNLVFRKVTENCYLVDSDFPRLKRNLLPLAISKCQYDVILTEIEPFKTSL